MCGIAEATMAISMISAAASYVESQNQAAAEQQRQRRMDQIAYENYQLNLKSINDKKQETREQAAQLGFDESVEGARAVGTSKVHFGEVGLGQFGMTGNSPDALFGDIGRQITTSRARRRGDLGNAYRTLNRQADAAYNGYLAKNASFEPIFSQSLLTPVAKIAGAGADYMGNKNRKFFKDPSGGFTPGGMFG